MLVSTLVGLVFTNILSITNAKFHDSLSGLLSQMPFSDFMSNSKSRKFQSLSQENKRLQKQNARFKKKNKIRKIKMVEAHKIFRRVARRTVKNVSLNVASIAGESIPYVGIGVILAVTASDVYDGCETMKDTNDLLKLLDVGEFKSEEQQVCGIKIPTEQQIKNYKREFDNILGGTVYEFFH